MGVHWRFFLFNNPTTKKGDGKKTISPMCWCIQIAWRPLTSNNNKRFLKIGSSSSPTILSGLATSFRECRLYSVDGEEKSGENIGRDAAKIRLTPAGCSLPSLVTRFLNHQLCVFYIQPPHFLHISPFKIVPPTHTKKNMFLHIPHFLRFNSAPIYYFRFKKNDNVQNTTP